MMRASHGQWAAILALAVLQAACGWQRHKGATGGRAVSQVEQAFLQAAAENRVPVRMLLGVAYLESGLNPGRSSAIYTNPVRDDVRQELGLQMTETAFGLSRLELGLSVAENPNALATQVDHYARWLAQQIEARELPLTPSPANIDQTFEWVWALARLHRPAIGSDEQNQVLFARELMQVLNQGFTWYDASSEAMVTLPPETPTLEVGKLPETRQGLFLDLSRRSPDVHWAQDWVDLSVGGGEVNNPTHVRVVHCPLSLSACLQLQWASPDGGEDVSLKAHYLLPYDNTLTRTQPLQVRYHIHPAEITNAAGNTELVTDAIVIMLTGYSGRYVGGVREDFRPTWLTDQQLLDLARLIDGVCAAMHRESREAYATCTQPFAPGGVQFQVQSAGRYRWGDVVDFDRTIFGEYLTEARKLRAGKVQFRLPGGRRQFRVDEVIPLVVEFPATVRAIELQQAVRCADQRLAWRTVYRQDTARETQHTIPRRVFGAGPNGDGEQFYRAIVRGREGELIGWVVDSLHVTGFDPDAPSETVRDCADSRLP